MIALPKGKFDVFACNAVVPFEGSASDGIRIAKCGWIENGLPDVLGEDRPLAKLIKRPVALTVCSDGHMEVVDDFTRIVVDNPTKIGWD
jgi:hypothetical protein